ncbi:MAG: DNA-binding protein WhiA [Clostridia bacterium]|jgi:DNA-binding protein WhiA|nr:DNA-binding protein WhiA [Clostridia bacterium]
MSFTGDVKAELSAIEPRNRGELMAEAYGMTLPCLDAALRRIRLQTESVDAAKRFAVLCEALCGAPVELSILGAGFLAEVEPEGDAVSQVLKALDIATDLPAVRLGRALLEDEACIEAFLRGLFLSAGAAADPEKSYRFELVIRQQRLSEDLEQLLWELSLPPAKTLRRRQHVLYYKSARSVQQILEKLGAARCALRMEQVRERRALTNEINRQTNSSLANIQRMARANARQNAALLQLEESGVLETLPGELREVARLRLERPEATLRELAEAMPEVSRSTIDRRLKKLVELWETTSEETK